MGKLLFKPQSFKMFYLNFKVSKNVSSILLFKGFSLLEILNLDSQNTIKFFHL